MLQTVEFIFTFHQWRNKTNKSIESFGSKNFHSIFWIGMCCCNRFTAIFNITLFQEEIWEKKYLINVFIDDFFKCPNLLTFKLLLPRITVAMRHYLILSIEKIPTIIFKLYLREVVFKSVFIFSLWASNKVLQIRSPLDFIGFYLQ